MNIALTDDLHQLLPSKVENGQFPNEEAVVKEALKRFLVGGAKFRPCQIVMRSERDLTANISAGASSGRARTLERLITGIMLNKNSL
jgi:Arc/MetJ-type ribon-helix-helix transcriptional regulator